MQTGCTTFSIPGCRPRAPGLWEFLADLWFYPLLPATRAWALACAVAAQEQATGTIVTASLPLFTPPAPPAGVVKRPEGTLTRIFDLVQEIKKINACTDSMCVDLGIIGPEEAPPDFDELRPNLTAKRMADHVKLGWTWQGKRRFLDQCEIQVDRADGKGWQNLTFDTTPGSEDTHLMPLALTKWLYRAIYRVDDVRVGQWSEEKEVVAGP